MVVEEAVLLLSTQEGLDKRAEMPLWLAGLFESVGVVGGGEGVGYLRSSGDDSGVGSGVGSGS
jgi:hypothetical protein